MEIFTKNKNKNSLVDYYFKYNGHLSKINKRNV